MGYIVPVIGAILAVSFLPDLAVAIQVILGLTGTVWTLKEGSKRWVPVVQLLLAVTAFGFSFTGFVTLMLQPTQIGCDVWVRFLNFFFFAQKFFTYLFLAWRYESLIVLGSTKSRLYPFVLGAVYGTGILGLVNFFTLDTFPFEDEAGTTCRTVFPPISIAIFVLFELFVYLAGLYLFVKPIREIAKASAGAKKNDDGAYERVIRGAYWSCLVVVVSGIAANILVYLVRIQSIPFEVAFIFRAFLHVDAMINVVIIAYGSRGVWELTPEFAEYKKSFDFLGFRNSKNASSSEIMLKEDRKADKEISSARGRGKPKLKPRSEDPLFSSSSDGLKNPSSDALKNPSSDSLPPSDGKSSESSIPIPEGKYLVPSGSYSRRSAKLDSQESLPSPEKAAPYKSRPSGPRSSGKQLTYTAAAPPSERFAPPPSAAAYGGAYNAGGEAGHFM